jgi:biopolymer transport protein ExbB/TolQ
MENIAKYIDYSLILVVGVTFSVILFKTIQFFSWGASSLREASTLPELEDALEQTESLLTLLAIIAATAPFMGLFGTIMHIITALQAMGSSSLDIKVIAGPIASSLYSTLLGLASAIPASVSYSLFQRRSQVLYNRQYRHLASSGLTD